MSEVPLDPSSIIRRVAESGMGVRFGRGVVAKTGYAVIALLVIWLGVVLKLGPSVVFDCFLVGSALIPSSFVVWWISSTQRFSERNPAQALLEGAEFIEYKKFEATAKGGLVAEGPLISDQSMQISPNKEGV